MTVDGSSRLADPAFDRTMASLGPFEPRPRLVVGVSGGRDSLALTLMAEGWARDRGGSVVAVTVDHGLREGSAAEAGQVARILAPFGIAHRIRRWCGVRPTSNLQAAARKARFRLLAAACREEHALHLCLGHHRGDQGETVALRAAWNSGEAGLAAMAGIRETASMRILRPLLARPRSDIEAYLERLGAAWIEDPTNLSHAYARNRLRSRLEPDDAARLADRAAAHAAGRTALDKAVARLLASAVMLDPAGIARVDAAALCDGPAGRAALGRLIQTMGGRTYPPRRENLARLADRLGNPGCAKATLGGVGFVRTGDGTRFWCGREPGRIRETLHLPPGGRALWDGRFVVTNGGPEPVTVAARRRAVPTERRPWPAWLDLALPAFHTPAGLPLGYGQENRGSDTLGGCRATFSPRRPLTETAFAPCSGEDGT